jgi:hypothetical protein
VSKTEVSAVEVEGNGSPAASHGFGVSRLLYFAGRRQEEGCKAMKRMPIKATEKRCSRLAFKLQSHWAFEKHRVGVDRGSCIYPGDR